MRLLISTVWIFTFGLPLWCLWSSLGLVLHLTYLLRPLARACFTMAALTLNPFEKTVVNHHYLRRHMVLNKWGKLTNIIWFILIGGLFSAAHFLAGLFFYITLIGIPFGRQHFKLAKLALAPIGKEVITIETKKSVEFVDNLERGWVAREIRAVNRDD